METSQQEDTSKVTNEEIDYKSKYEELQGKFDTLSSQFNEMKETYVIMCNGQTQASKANTDEFDELCHRKFDRQQ